MADVMRQQYRALSDREKSVIDQIKSIAADLYDLIDAEKPSREHSLAKTKIEEACMWAVKGMTSAPAELVEVIDVEEGETVDGLIIERPDGTTVEWHAGEQEGPSNG